MEQGSSYMRSKRCGKRAFIAIKHETLSEKMFEKISIWQSYNITQAGKYLHIQRKAIGVEDTYLEYTYKDAIKRNFFVAFCIRLTL